MSLCKLCDIKDWDDPEFREFAPAIMGGEAVRHRKLWEFTQAVRALKRFGLLDDRAHLLSIAAGTERVLFYLANHVRRIIATDIYGLSSFSDEEATPEFLKDTEPFAPYPFRKDHLNALSMDALHLRFPENSIDGIISLSSLEHFGGLQAALRSFIEIERVLKPGGIAVVVTDCSSNDRGTDQVFTKRDIQTLLEHTSLQPVDEISWQQSPEAQKIVTDIKRGNLLELPHINLQVFSSVFTSICLVLQKPGKFAYSDPNEFDAMYQAVANLPFERSSFQAPMSDKLRGKTRCFLRRVERKVEKILTLTNFNLRSDSKISEV